jgi:hypothetical protein|tara:strand:+ start:5387 stop:5812 length:426 start_codon:yes stop_codon:yes gene_type:complete
MRTLKQLEELLVESDKKINKLKEDIETATQYKHSIVMQITDYIKDAGDNYNATELPNVIKNGIPDIDTNEVNLYEGSDEEEFDQLQERADRMIKEKAAAEAAAVQEAMQADGKGAKPDPLPEGEDLLTATDGSPLITETPK